VLNLSKTAAYRAPGTPAAMFGGESAINELAEQLGIDPLELRLKNASKQGDHRANGQVFRNPIGNIEVIQATKDHPHYRSELQGENRGRGVSLGFWGNVGGETSSSASINAAAARQPRARLGGHRRHTRLGAMQLAETLGIPYERAASCRRHGLD
jgi:CO/xanthine dehydrogenase Mo-binding subunit